VIQPTSSTSANVIASQSANITGVKEVSEGVYCVTPASPINAAGEATAVSPEVSYSSAGAPGVIALNAQHPHCSASAFEVDTYAPGGTTLKTGYAFTIVVP
jgi:hypothetical protein